MIRAVEVEIEISRDMEPRRDLVPIEEFRLAARDAREAADDEFGAFARAVRGDGSARRRKKKRRSASQD